MKNESRYDALANVMAGRDFRLSFFANLTKSVSHFCSIEKLAVCGPILNQYFQHFLQAGLPLHSIDAIKNVDWQIFTEGGCVIAIHKAKKYLARISRLNPSMQQSIREKFGIEPEVLEDTIC